jgi:hypothetical protein
MSTTHQDNAGKQFDSVLLDEYQGFLSTHRGLAKETIRIRASYVAPFLAELGIRSSPTARGYFGELCSRLRDTNRPTIAM